MAAEFMQPGLEQLQPNFDFTDTFEPIQGNQCVGLFVPSLPLPLVQLI